MTKFQREINNKKIVRINNNSYAVFQVDKKIRFEFSAK